MPLCLKDWTEPMTKQERAELKAVAAYERNLEKRVADLEAEIGRLRAAFRANMLRYGPPENLDAEIDRVLAECATQ